MKIVYNYSFLLALKVFYYRFPALDIKFITRSTKFAPPHIEFPFEIWNFPTSICEFPRQAKIPAFPYVQPFLRIFPMAFLRIVPNIASFSENYRRKKESLDFPTSTAKRRSRGRRRRWLAVATQRPVTSSWIFSQVEGDVNELRGSVDWESRRRCSRVNILWIRP